MQQAITIEQWNQLSYKKKMILVNFFKIEKMQYLTIREIKSGSVNVHLLTIGQLIEYLGEDIEDMLQDTDRKLWFVWKYKAKDKKEVEDFEAKELIDALWEATKHKLKK